MLRKLVLLVGCGLVAVGLSGCCLFHCGCGYGGYCGAGYYDGYGLGGCVVEGSYGACVTPAGCPGCGTGMYGAYVDPVQRARAVRLQRIHRCRRYAAGRGPRPQRPYCGRGGYGCQDDYLACGFDDCGFAGGYCDHGACGDGMPCGADLSYGGELGGDWMPASGAPCQCGSDMPTSFSEGGWVEGPWVEATPQPGATESPASEPKAMPMNQAVPDPMPVTHEQYYSPRSYPTPVQGDGPETQIHSSSGGSPIQPVLWVPGGL